MQCLNFIAHNNLDACSTELIGDYEWPLTDLIPGTVEVLLNCPCESLRGSNLQYARASRVCGGNFSAGASWETPDTSPCTFDSLTQRICNSSQVKY